MIISSIFLKDPNLSTVLKGLNIRKIRIKVKFFILEILYNTAIKTIVKSKTFQ